MISACSTRSRVHVAAALTLAAALGGARAGELAPALAALAQLSPRTTSAVVIELEGARAIDEYAAQLAALPRAARPGRLAQLMRQDFDAAAASVLAELHTAGGWAVQPLWIAHSIAAQVTRGKLAQLAELPGVKRIDADTGLRSVGARSDGAPAGVAVRRGPAQRLQTHAQVTPQAATQATPQAASALDAMASGRALNLPPHFLALDVLAAWRRGHAGQGVTVAVVDSGVDLRAPAIARGWRGRNADWFDPYAQQQTPVDFSGHGTLVAGLLVGGLIDDTPIGVAPQARWIAARLFDDAGQGRVSAVQRIYQWVLDPDGDPATSDAPDIVNNSWGLPQSAGQCNTSFARALAALRAADIHVVFAAGNDGPASSTSMSPANNPGVLSVGALDADRGIAARSSRGPSGCGGGAFPSIYAPGANLPALDRVAAVTGSAALADGTSFAAAAVSGALAVLRSAAPHASRSEIESQLMRTAQHADAAAGTPPAPAPHWPSLGAALAAANPVLGGNPSAPVLRWAPLVEAGKPVQISSESLRNVLPWSLHAAAIRPMTRPESGRLESKTSGLAWLLGRSTAWSYEPDALQPQPMRFEIETREGPELVLLLDPQAPAAITLQPRPRQSVQTALNHSVQVPLTPELQQAPAETLRLTTPLRGGKVKRLADGQVEYTPPVNFVGTDQFTYSLRAAAGSASVPTTVMVQVVQQ